MIDTARHGNAARGPHHDRVVARSRLPQNLALVVIALGLASGLVACGDDDGSPSSLIDEPRILALRAEPPVVTLGDRATIAVLVAGGSADALPVAADSSELQAASSPDERALDGTGWELSYRACSPWRVLGNPATDCPLEEALVLPDSGLSAELTVADVLERFPPPAWVVTEVLENADNGDTDDPSLGCDYSFVDLPIIVEARMPDEGIELIAVKNIRAVAPGVTRGNPAIDALALDGVVGARSFAPGQPHVLDIELRQDTLDSTCDDEPVLEPVRAYLYVDSGRLEEPYVDIEQGPDGEIFADSVVWQAPAESEMARFWLVVIDRDGGVGWSRVDLEPSG